MQSSVIHKLNQQKKNLFENNATNYRFKLQECVPGVLNAVPQFYSELKQFMIIKANHYA